MGGFSISKKFKPKFLYKEYNRKIKKDHFTLVFAFSRLWCVDKIFQSLNSMKIPLDKCHLLIYDNSDKAPLKDYLLLKLKRYKKVFASMRYYKSYRKGATVLKGMKDYKWENTKLPPINKMYRDYKWIIKTDRFISIEDDTYCPPNTIMRLLSMLDKYNNKVFVTGIETSRCDDPLAKIVLGDYYIKEVDGKIVEKVSLDPKRKNSVEVDACGWYCFATTKKIWDMGFRGLKLHQDHIKHFATDIYHTYNLHKKGIPIIADFRIRCLHMHISPRGIIFFNPDNAFPSLDYYIEKYNVWGIFIPLKKEIRL